MSRASSSKIAGTSSGMRGYRWRLREGEKRVNHGLGLDSATVEMLSQPKRSIRSTLKALLLRFSRTQDEDWEADQDEPWR